MLGYILNRSEFEIKNGQHHLICKEMPSEGLSNSVFLVNDVISKKITVYGWDALSHLIWELMDCEEVHDEDIRTVESNVKLEI